MLNRIEKSSSPAPLEPFFESPSRFQPNWDSSITSVKSKSVDYKKRLTEILNSVWNFIKVYFLFFCYDKDKDKIIAKQKQIKGFIELYYDARGKDLESQTERVVREFSNLDESVRKDIRAEIEAILREQFSNRSGKFYQREVDMTLENPLQDLEKTDGSRPIQVFATAILKVQEKYTGF